MANIYVGFHDRKSCNRILKPPGGGTSDIFNTSLGEKVVESDNAKSTLLLSETTPIIATEENNVDCPVNGTDIKTSDGKIGTEENQPSCVNVPDNSEDPKIETLNISDENNKDEAQEKTDDKKDIAEVNSPKSESISSVIHENQHKEKVTTPEKKIGQRVPPGGYSSGLW